MLTNAIRDTYITQKIKLREQVSTDNNRSKTLYKITKTLTTNTKENVFPSSSSFKELADSLLTSL